MREIIERFRSDRDLLARFHEPMLWPQAHDRMEEFLGVWESELARLPFERMERAAQVDYLLLKNTVAKERAQLNLRRKRLEEIAPLIPFAEAAGRLHTELRRKETIEGRAAASRLNEIKKAAERARKVVEAAYPSPDRKEEEDSEKVPSSQLSAVRRLPKAAVHRATGVIAEIQKALEEWFRFYKGYDPDFTWWAAQPYRAASQALSGYVASLRRRGLGIESGDDEPVFGDPLGRKPLLRALAGEMIAYTPEELVEIARKEMAWCKAEMLRASRELGYGEDWREALEHVKTLHVEPGEQPELIRNQAAEAVEFLKERDLITIPELAREAWRMEMMPPERQKVNPFFTGGEVIRVSFPAQEMTHEQKLMSMRGNNIHFSRATVHHELIPGHHLQQFMNERYRPYRRVFKTPFWTEGWAFYWEMLLWDLDFPQSPENRIGMLFWRMHRCARVIFSLGFHLGQMTEQECIDLLTGGVGHEPKDAVAEVRRSLAGDYPPLYQSAYLVGALQFRALRRELAEEGEMTDREFHDAVLKLNAIPVEMVRASLTDEQLRRDYAAEWKFYAD